jgi:hypothetical protein
VNGFVARTETPGLRGNQYAYNGGAEYRSRVHRAYYEYGKIGEDFNPEVGFLRRTEGSIRMAAGWFGTYRTPKVRELGFRELLPHVSYVRYEDLQDGWRPRRCTWIRISIGRTGTPGARHQHPVGGAQAPFGSPHHRPPGNYRSPHTVYRMNTDRRKALSGSFDWDYGYFLTGHMNNMSPAATFRKGGNFTIVSRWTRNNINLPQGAFKTNLATLRATYNFTPAILAQTLTYKRLHQPGHQPPVQLVEDANTDLLVAND